MCMTKREKALSRFYNEIMEVFANDPEKGLAATKRTMALADEHTAKNLTGSKSGKEYTKKVPKHSVDTIKETVKEEFFPKKKNKAEEALAHFEELIAKQKGQEQEEQERVEE